MPNKNLGITEKKKKNWRLEKVTYRFDLFNFVYPEVYSYSEKKKNQTKKKKKKKRKLEKSNIHIALNLRNLPERRSNCFSSDKIFPMNQKIGKFWNLIISGAVKYVSSSLAWHGAGKWRLSWQFLRNCEHLQQDKREGKIKININ